MYTNHEVTSCEVVGNMEVWWIKKNKEEGTLLGLGNTDCTGRLTVGTGILVFIASTAYR